MRKEEIKDTEKVQHHFSTIQFLQVVMINAKGRSTVELSDGGYEV